MRRVPRTESAFEASEGEDEEEREKGWGGFMVHENLKRERDSGVL